MEVKKKILVLGGLGFIGKNLYNGLVQDQHQVTILTDAMHQADDGFLTAASIKDIILGNILDKDFMEQAVAGYDVIFSLAGSSGAADSIQNPYHDLDTNLKGHLNILEACRKHNPHALLIFPSSRLVYGRPEKNPVDETQALHPESIYAIHKVTTEHYYLLYNKLYNLNCVIFRVANPFGPYQRFGSNHYGILNWFIHKALAKEEIEIYGDGSQKRDFIYIDDVVNLFKRSMRDTTMAGKIYNVGCGQGISIRQTVEIIQRYVPAARVKFKPWPELDQKIETGDYISDITLLKTMGWHPTTTFEEGMKKTIEFYGRQIR